MGENTLMIGTDYGHADSSTELDALTTLKNSGGISAAQHKRSSRTIRGHFTAWREGRRIRRRYGEQVTDSEKLQDVLKRGLEANRNGKPAIVDVTAIQNGEG